MYNINTDQWFDLPNLNNEREDVSLCIVEDRYLYVFGSIVSKGRRNKLQSTSATGIEYTIEWIDLMHLETI